MSKIDHSQFWEIHGEEISPKTLASIEDKQVVVVMGWGKWDEWKWGDAYMLAENIDYDLIVSAVGGPNAGHQVYDKDWRKFVWHNLPWAAMTGKDVFLWQWKSINIQWLVEEINALKELWISPNIKIARGAHCIFPSFHGKLDGSIEDMKSKTGNQVGTTKSGMWPVVATRALRSNPTIGWICEMDHNEIDANITELIYPFNPEAVWDTQELSQEYKAHKSELEFLISNGDVEIVDNDYARQCYDEDMKMLIEWSQSPSLGMFWGAYPYNTSTDTSFWGIMSSLLIEPTPDRVWKYVVAKLFPSAVWEHEFPEQISKILLEGWILEKEEKFADETDEKWSTTGRPRKIALPSPELLADEANSPFTIAVAIRKLDMLQKMQEILGWDMLPFASYYWEDWEVVPEEVAYSYKEIVEMYRSVLMKVIWKKKWKTMPIILWYWPKPQDSRIDLPIAA